MKAFLNYDLGTTELTSAPQHYKEYSNNVGYKSFFVSFLFVLVLVSKHNQRYKLKKSRARKVSTSKKLKDGREIPWNVYTVKSPGKAKVVKLVPLVEDEHGKIFHLHLQCPPEFKYATGQSIQVCVPDGPPRSYTICSSYEADKENIHLCVKLVNYINEEGNTVTGVSSGMISNLQAGNIINVSGPVGKDLLMPKTKTPIRYVVIANGTGTAAAMAILRENIKIPETENFLKSEIPCTSSENEFHFYLGFPAKSSTLYKREFEIAKSSGANISIKIAYSREGRRERVTDIVSRDMEKILAFAKEPNTHIYICGAKGLKKSIQDVLSREPGLEKAMKKEDRLHIEVY